jgi:enamine deaminase RidA (YjgF/YER057c/UK114 family)
MFIEQRLKELGLVLPEPMKVGAGMRLPFQWVRIHGDRAYVSGHGPSNPDGSMAGPLGKVGAEVSLDEARESARLTTLSMLGSLKRALGDLDRIQAWLMVSGMVNVAPGFTATVHVLNGCSDLLLEIFGTEVGSHARFAVGMAQLPMGLPVEIAAEVAVRGA